MNFYRDGEYDMVKPVYFFTMDTNINTTGKRIKYLRETVNHWKGKEFLEELLGRTGEQVQSSTLTNHEKDTAMPGYKTLVNYAKTLGTTTDFLLLLTDDPSQDKKSDRNVVIEVRGEEDRRIVEEIGSALEEMPVGDLRLILDVVRRLTPGGYTLAASNKEVEIEPLIGIILDTIEQIGGEDMRKRAVRQLEAAMPPNSPLAASWRRMRSQRQSKQS
jgi:transcriptional regulator with XRE-family HTH domain